MFDDLQNVIKLLETKGAQFIEARFDELILRTIIKESGRIDQLKTINRSGVGFIVYFKGVNAYSYTADTSMKALEQAGIYALKLAMASEAQAKLKLGFKPMLPIKNVKLVPSLKKAPWVADESTILDMINRIETLGSEKAKDLQSIITAYGELSGSKIFTNSDGTEIEWHPYLVGLSTRITARAENGDLITGSHGYGGSFGLEHFDEKEKTPETIASNAAQRVNEMRVAKLPPSGKQRVVCDNQLVGVLAHESFGHLTEADCIISRSGPLHNKLGKKLGTEIVTIIDEGTPTPSLDVTPMWLPFDDEGVPTTKTILIEKGVLKGFLTTRETAVVLRKMGLTGNARAIDFSFFPIPRMKNTYFEPGDLTDEEIFNDLGTGVYAISSTGGQVELSGDFVFGSQMGYWIENGEKKYPLRNIMLRGNILEILKNVEGASRDFKLESSFFGGCGKGGQSPLPVGLGGPKLLIKDVFIGGKS